jgi:adenylate/guanylate cyclase family protein
MASMQRTIPERDVCAWLAQIRSYRRTLIDRRINENHGRIAKTMGDGMLVEFACALHAVRCAVDIQREMMEWNADLSSDKRIEFRIGINMGDIIIADNGDIFGDVVNVAARLEGIAEPGGICLSWWYADAEFLTDQLVLHVPDAVAPRRRGPRCSAMPRPLAPQPASRSSSTAISACAARGRTAAEFCSANQSSSRPTRAIFASHLLTRVNSIAASKQG